VRSGEDAVASSVVLFRMGRFLSFVLSFLFLLFISYLVGGHLFFIIVVCFLALLLFLIVVFFTIDRAYFLILDALFLNHLLEWHRDTCLFNWCHKSYCIVILPMSCMHFRCCDLEYLEPFVANGLNRFKFYIPYLVLSFQNQ
jgi:hypothetical protein